MRFCRGFYKRWKVLRSRQNFFCLGLDIGVPQIVKAYVPQIVSLQQRRKMLRDKARLHQFPHLVHIDVLAVVVAVHPAAEFLVPFLLRFQLVQQFLKRCNQRQGAETGFRLGAVFLHKGAFAVNAHLCNRVADGDGLLHKVDCAPLEADSFSPAQPIKGGKDDAKLDGLAFHQREQLFQFLGVVHTASKFVFLGALYPVGRVRVENPGFEGVLQRLSDVGMAVDDGVCADAQLPYFVTVKRWPYGHATGVSPLRILMPSGPHCPCWRTLV